MKDKRTYEDRKEYYRKYRALNKQKLKKYCEDNKESFDKYRRNTKNRFSILRNTAKYRNKEFDLTLEEYIIIVNKPCFYCDKNLENEKGHSLDRIDNKIGYIIKNVLPCCGNCNTVRSDILTVEEMKIGMEAILNYRKNK